MSMPSPTPLLWGGVLRAIDQGVEREGAYYLFALRLVPAFPFFAINLAMGLTAIRPWTFYWVSQLGMLAGTVLYVYAGTQLGQFQITWQLVVALALLGIFPLAARKMLDALNARKVYARWTRPRRFDSSIRFSTRFRHSGSMPCTRKRSLRQSVVR